VTVSCGKCGRTYDDAECWTICPHTPLGSPINEYDPKKNPSGYCREHDLVGPHLHEER
jgi:hypothetical protein